jgi:hypothetical protein
LKDYWSQPGVSILDSAYRAIVPPAAKFASVTRKDDLQIVQPETTVASFIGYLGSWSGVARYKQMHPDKPSPLVELQAKYGISRNEGTFLSYFWSVAYVNHDIHLQAGATSWRQAIHCHIPHLYGPREKACITNS